MTRINWGTLKKLISICLLVGIRLQGAAQGVTIADSLNRVIDNNHISPESRVLASIRRGEYYINKPGRGPKDLDSASASLKYAEQLNKRFNLHVTDGEQLFLSGLINKQKGLRKEGERLNDLALTFLRKKPGNDFLGRALLEKGDYLNTADDAQLMQKIALLRQAVTCFASPEYAKSRAGTWKSIGDLYGLRPISPGNMGAALDAYQRAMSAYFSFGYRNVQDIYIEMALIYKHLGDQQQGLRYCLMAIQTAERARDTSMTLCEIYNYTGMQYRSLLDYANAKKYFILAFNIAEKYKDANGIFSIEINLNSAYLHQRNYNKLKHSIDHVYTQYPATDSLNQYVSYTWYLRYYTAIKDVANGKKYVALLVKLTSDTTASLLRYSGRDTYTAMASFYALIHDFKNAYKYWDKGYAITLKYDNSPGNRNLVIYDRYKIDSANSQWRSATYYLRLYTDGRDSIYSANKAALEANLRVLYDTKANEYRLEKSRQEIQVLTQNENLQRSNLKQAVFIRNITIVFTIIVIIVSLLLYRMVGLYKKGMKKISKTNSILEKLVSEKEWLLREIHHRVKNNLHTVICLLESQAAYLEKDALKAIDDSRHRIYAMSLIHQKLYENEDVKTVDMNDFITALVHYLQDSYNLKSDIIFHLDIAPVLIDTSIAIPISLIINEAITNSIKYAFTNGNKGEITIRLFEENEKIVVIMADNGVGIDMDLVNKSIPSMGLRLIKGLCADIGGKILFRNNQGTQIKLICNRVLVDDDEINMEELLNNIPDAIES